MTDIEFQLEKELFTTKLELAGQILIAFVKGGFIDDDLGALSAKLADQLFAAINWDAHIAKVKEYYDKKADLAEGLVASFISGKSGQA